MNMKWFTDEFKKHSIAKLDIGKSCIRFKRGCKNYCAGMDPIV